MSSDLDSAAHRFTGPPPAHPEALLAELREKDPVHWIPGIDAWFLTRHDDVRLFLSDPRVTADPRAYERYKAPSEPGAARWLAEMPFRSTSSDPQTLGRRLVSAALTPRAIARMERRVAEVVEEFAAPLRNRTGVADLTAEFTSPVSSTVVERILGIPPIGADADRFRALARKATRAIDPIVSDRKRERTEQATVEIAEYVLSLVHARASEARDDLISDLVRASKEDTPSTAEDIARVVGGLISAGTGTTSLAATRALRSLLGHPVELALLREDRSLLPNAAEELLRFDSGVAGMPRYVLRDFELRGRALRRGQLMVLSLLGANRDPRVFADPDRLDLRRDTRDALSFGQGPHYCIGANLARAELRMMIDAALDFLPPGAKLNEEEIRWSEKGVLSQIRGLPVHLLR